VTSKRRKGFPSESDVKRGDRVVGGAKELTEKLGRNDPCPCGSARSFQALLPAQRLLLTASIATTTSADRQPIVRV
jgi:SEC-C motif